MVRINLIDPWRLADQHLVAEYNEILMLLGYVKKFPGVDGIPEEFTLGKGHIKFFKNKLKYLKSRFETVSKEMRKRGFRTDKIIDLDEFADELKNNWKPVDKDFETIKERLIEKLKMKENYYRYKGSYESQKFFVDLISDGKK